MTNYDLFDKEKTIETINEVMHLLEISKKKIDTCAFHDFENHILNGKRGLQFILDDMERVKERYKI